MTVEIWSDIRCPFCYIGKRHFEEALEQFAHKEEVEVIWHSFQLDPGLKTRPEIEALDHFIHTKGISEIEARQMFKRVQEMARETGLHLNLESTVVANSYRAHLLLQLSKPKGLANKVKEILFKAHFSEGKNIDDPAVLLDLAEKIGIPRSEVENALVSDELGYAVKQDQMYAQQIGIQGVPFFLIDNKYALSGAQPASLFLESLEKVKSTQ